MTSPHESIIQQMTPNTAAAMTATTTSSPTTITTPKPRPIPQFFNDQFNHLTTKRERLNNRSTPITAKQLPPRPPSKSFTQYSRLQSFTMNNSISNNSNNSNHHRQDKAKIISFKKERHQPQLSPLYDHNQRESYFKQCYYIEERIGSGSFGDVFRCRNLYDQQYYAIKVSREKFKGRIDREEKLNEVCKHEQLPDHDHLVKLHCAWEEKQRLYIETELCAGTLSMLADNNHDLPESTVWAILVDLLKAINHLHINNLIHLDIKPENIFISRDGICKLGDFGLIFDMNNHEFKEANEGDPKYLAGEVMQGIFTQSADIFSLGMTILEIACDLDLPSRGDAWHLLRNGSIPDHIFKHRSDDLKKIIKMMLNPDHTKRPTAQELLNHPLIIEHEYQRRKEVFRKKFHNKLKQVITVVDSICIEQLLFKQLWSFFKQMLNILSYPFKYWFAKPQSLSPETNNCDMILESLQQTPDSSQSIDNSGSNCRTNINYNRTYVSNYLDQYSDDEMIDTTNNNQSRFMSSNLSFDMSYGSSSDDEFFGDNGSQQPFNHKHLKSFELLNDLSNRNLCSTVNRANHRLNFEMTPKLSPLQNDAAENIDRMMTSPNVNSMKSVIQRLTFDEFSSDEMEMSEDNDDNDDEPNDEIESPSMTSNNYNPNSDDSFVKNPKQSFIHHSEISGDSFHHFNNNNNNHNTSNCNLRYLKNANISRKNLLKSFDEIDEMVS